MNPTVRLSEDDLQRIAVAVVEALALRTPDPLAKRTYLTVRQLGEYLGNWTPGQTHEWLKKRPDIRRTREGNSLIVWRKDVDSQLEINAVTYAAKQRR